MDSMILHNLLILFLKVSFHHIMMQDLTKTSRIYVLDLEAIGDVLALHHPQWTTNSIFMCTFLYLNRNYNCNWNCSSFKELVFIYLATSKYVFLLQGLIHFMLWYPDHGSGCIQTKAVAETKSLAVYLLKWKYHMSCYHVRLMWHGPCFTLLKYTAPLHSLIRFQ